MKKTISETVKFHLFDRHMNPLSESELYLVTKYGNDLLDKLLEEKINVLLNKTSEKLPIDKQYGNVL